jgi:uncharacterized protein
VEQHVNLRTRITEDMTTAMKAKDSARLAAIRLLLAALKQKEVDERIELDDAAVIAIVDKMIKQRKDSVAQYTAGGRIDLAAAEQFEIEMLSGYQPTRLGTEEIAAAVAAAIAETGATGPADMGKAMGLLKQRLAGQADMGEVSRLLKSALAG